MVILDTTKNAKYSSESNTTIELVLIYPLTAALEPPPPRGVVLPEGHGAVQEQVRTLPRDRLLPGARNARSPGEHVSFRYIEESS